MVRFALLVLMFLRANLALNTLPRIIHKPLPTVYVYDHCPFCVRVRLALGLKNIKHKVVYLANDDIDTPTALVGKKIAPIFEADGYAMMESLDIIAKVDGDAKYGPVGFFKDSSNRKDIKDWQGRVADNNRILQRPRYMKTILPEFQQQEGKDAFVMNHPLPPFEKADWKAMSYEERWSRYNGAYETSFGLIEDTNKALAELDKLVFSKDCCTEGGLSYDDIDLWSRLRSVTLVKGVTWPLKLRAYMDNLAVLGDVPLYDCMAC